MPISFITAGDNSAGFTSFGAQAGDLITCVGFNSSDVSVTAPSGWTSVYSNTTGTVRCNLAYKIASSSSEPLGSWTNGVAFIWHVYRGAKQIGATSGVSTTALRYFFPGVTCNNQDNTSRVARLGLTLYNLALDEQPIADASANGLVLRSSSNWSAFGDSEVVASTGETSNTVNSLAEYLGPAGALEQSFMITVTFEIEESKGGFRYYYITG